MIGNVVAGVVGVVGGIAASGAGYRMASGVVRGVGRLVEGDPVAALREVKDGIVEPVYIAGAQFTGLVTNTADVVVYTALKAASVGSDGAKDLIERAAGFDMVTLKIAMGMILPDTGPQEVFPRPAAKTA